MTIKIVTDSTCDLPEELIEKHGITVIPLYINFGEKSYLDGKELTREEFYKRMAEGQVQPTTATPGLDTFKQAYHHLIDQGADEVLSIHISHSLSATINVARAAAQDTGYPVTVLDSGQLSLGEGFMVLQAARLAANGKSMEEILASLKQTSENTFVVAALDTMEFLRRSGRMNSFIVGIGSLLHVKPILKMHIGNPTSALVRTRERALQRLVKTVNDLAPIKEIALLHTNAPQEAKKLWERVKSHFPEIDDPLSVNVTPVLGVHLGPGTVGFALKTGE